MRLNTTQTDTLCEYCLRTITIFTKLSLDGHMRIGLNPKQIQTSKLYFRDSDSFELSIRKLINYAYIYNMIINELINANGIQE